jgi:nucleoside-diphosphate-sugar epimerase
VDVHPGSAAPLAFQRARAKAFVDSRLRIAVTGASGWLGQATLEMLEQALEDRFEERVYAFGSHPRPFRLRSGRSIEIASLGALASLPPAPTLLLHYAFLTKERTTAMALDAYYRSSEEISRTVAEAMRKVGVKKMLFPSSGAVYGLPTRADRSVREDPVANPYGTQKLRDEHCFSTGCKKLGIRLAMPRIFSLSGPFINKHDSYALASIINFALSGKPVQLRARRRVVRSYLAIRDLLDATIGWLLASREPGQMSFDTGGEIVEVGDLARRALQVLDCRYLPIVRPELEHEPDDVYVGDGAYLERLASEQGIRLAPLDQQIAETAVYLKESQ